MLLVATLLHTSASYREAITPTSLRADGWCLVIGAEISADPQDFNILRVVFFVPRLLRGLANSPVGVIEYAPSGRWNFNMFINVFPVLGPNAILAVGCARGPLTADSVPVAPHL